MSGERRYLTLMLVPDGGRESRSFRLSYGALRILGGAAALLALALTVMAGSWWYLVARASRVDNLQAEVRALEAQGARVEVLAEELQRLEERYGDIRSLLGAGPADSPSEVWLPPSSGTRSRSASGTQRLERGPSAPRSWPLTQRGFVTQGLLEEGMGEHPGLDIAVPSDSYVRAAGGGMVVDTGEDPVYGRFVVIDHGDGYTSLYGHASLTLVTRGQRVRENEVIALTGSTGRSTAPHLHFEVLRDGEAVDPLSMVSQP